MLKCDEFRNDGFRCVPYYACKGGEIITNGAGLLNTRTLVFNPEDAICEENVENICCRLPEWKDLPLEQEIPLPPPIPHECLYNSKL